eukprot:6882676-Alexandrium_andersonii.AAC.1
MASGEGLPCICHPRQRVVAGRVRLQRGREARAKVAGPRLASRDAPTCCRAIAVGQRGFLDPREC